MLKSRNWVSKTLISPCSSPKKSLKRKKTTSRVSHPRSHGSLEPVKTNWKNISPFVLPPKQSCTPTTKNGFAVIVTCLSNSINGIQVPYPHNPLLNVGERLTGSRSLGV